VLSSSLAVVVVSFGEEMEDRVVSLLVMAMGQL